MENPLGDRIREFFPMDAYCLPGAWCLWFALLCLFVARDSGHGRLALMLVPALVLMITVSIGTPINRLERYILAAQLSLPIYLVVLRRCGERDALR